MSGIQRKSKPMNHPIHKPVVEQITKVLDLLDDFMRDRIDLDVCSKKLMELNVDELLETYQDDFKTDTSLIYYLDALMLISSLQHELDFQVQEYGANVALEDMKNLRELMNKFPHRYLGEE